jgi:hypothetical protein
MSLPNLNLLQIALYAFPLGWLALFFVSLLKFSISYVPLPALVVWTLMLTLFTFPAFCLSSSWRWYSTSPTFSASRKYKERLAAIDPDQYLRNSTNRYADRDAKRQWANSVSSGAFGLPGLGGIGGQLLGGAIRNGLGRVFT